MEKLIFTSMLTSGRSTSGRSATQAAVDLHLDPSQPGRRSRFSRSLMMKNRTQEVDLQRTRSRRPRLLVEARSTSSRENTHSWRDLLGWVPLFPKWLSTSKSSHSTRRCITNTPKNLDKDKLRKKWNILRKSKELYLWLRLQMIKMAFTGSRSSSFSYKDTAILASGTKLLCCSTCFMMELTGNFRRHSDQS